MNHTPGPWIAIVPPDRWIYEGSDLTCYCVMTEATREELRIAGHDHYRPDPGSVDNVVICDQFLRDMTLEEGQANARLIAEAPNMLDALRQVLAWRGLDGDGISDPVRQHVIDAIAKATQGDPS